MFFLGFVLLTVVGLAGFGSVLPMLFFVKICVAFHKKVCWVRLPIADDCVCIGFHSDPIGFSMVCMCFQSDPIGFHWLSWFSLLFMDLC